MKEKRIKGDQTTTKERSKEHTIAGAGLGVASYASLAVFGVTCPLCIVAAPALLCSGAWHAHKARKEGRESDEAALPCAPIQQEAL